MCGITFVGSSCSLQAAPESTSLRQGTRSCSGSKALEDPASRALAVGFASRLDVSGAPDSLSQASWNTFLYSFRYWLAALSRS